MQISINGLSPNIDQSAFIAPTATVIGAVSLLSGASVWFGSTIRADINKISIGEFTNVQDGCLLHVTQQYPVFIGNRVTVGHGVILHGCTVEDFCLIGMGATVLDGVRIGKGSLVAAGSLIPPGMDIPPNSLIIGSPARIKRAINEGERQLIDEGWQHYVEYAKRYRNEAKIID